MARIEDESDDFMARVMDVLVDAGQRQLQKIDPKKVKEIASELRTLKDEKLAAHELQESQKSQYDKIYEEVVSYLEAMSREELLELPEEVKREMENAERKIKAEQAKAAAAAAEELAPEPE